MNKISLLLLFFWSLLCAYGARADLYSVNLLWVNDNDDKANKPYLCGNANEKEYRDKCLGPALKWRSALGKEPKIYLWYDSLFTNDAALNKAQQDFGGHVVLRDVRLLDLVKRDPEVFSARVPIYFRVDLLRVILAQESAIKREDRYIVYADFNVPPLHEAQLFDSETKDLLNLYGLVMAKNENPDDKFENGFFILDSENQAMLQASQFGLIDINIERAKEFLRSGYLTKDKAGELGMALCRSRFPEVVWISYPAMFSYYLYLKMAAEIDPKEVVYSKRYLYNNAALLNDQKELFLFNPLIKHDFDLFYRSGYAQVDLHATLASDWQKKRAILRAVSHPTDDAESRVLAEEARRRNQRDFPFFTVHDSRPAQGISYWKMIDVTITTSVFGKVQNAVFYALEPQKSLRIPIKDVKKPKSHFSGGTPKLAPDDC
jgi:hypothetical protein